MLKANETKLPFAMRLQLFGNEDINSGDVEVADDNENNKLENNIEDDNLDDEDDNLDDESENKEDVADLPDKKQSKEQDHAFADMRRRLQDTERAAKQYEMELQQRDQWVKQMFSQYGVTNWPDYQAKMENQIKHEREQQLRDAGVDPRIVQELIKNDPELQTLKQQNQQLQKQMQEERENSRMVGEYNELIKEFGQDFPELNEPNNIPKEVWERFNKGYSMVDAFYVTQRGKIMEKQTAKAKQSTLNNINSKSHLKTEGDGAKEGEDVNIPKDVMATFKEMGFSKKEAQKYYKQFYK